MNASRLSIVVLLLLVLAACGSPTPEPTALSSTGTEESTPEPRATTTHGPSTPTATPVAANALKLVFLLSSIDSPRQQTFEELLTENTQSITGTVQVQAADNDTRTQRQQVENALAEGASVLVIQPVDADAAAAYVDMAHKAGARVIAFDRLINTRDLDAYVSHDLAQTGRIQAQAAVDWLTANKTKTPWNFVLLEGAAGDPLAGEITRGYRQVLDPLIAKNQVKVAADRANDQWSAAQGQAALQEELPKLKNNVQAVLAHNSALARGALAALDAHKLVGKVFVAGSGAELDNLRAICSGAQNLELTRDDEELARAAARLATAFVNGTSPTDAGFANNRLRVDDREVFHVAIPVRAITLETVQAALVQTGVVTPRQLGSCAPPLVSGVTVPQVQARGTLTVWVQEEAASPVYAYLANLAGAYMAANPGVEIKLLPRDAQTVRETFPDATDAVDLLWTTNEEIQHFAASDLLRPVDFINAGQFAAPAIAGGTRDGTLYGVPVATGNNLLLYYNKKLLRTPPENTDALIRLGATLTKEANGQYTLVYDTTDPFWLMPWLGAYKSSVVAEDGRTPTLDTRAMTETLTLLKTFRDKKVAAPDADHLIADAIFIEGRAAMIINGDEALPAYLAKFGTDLGVTRIPQVSKNELPRPYTGGTYFALPAGVSAGKLEIAQGLIQLVTSKAIQVDMAKKFRRLPALNDALKDTGVTGDALLKGMSDQMALGIPPPDSSILTCIWESIRPNQIAVINGQSQPDAAAKAMQSAATACLDKLP